MIKEYSQYPRLKYTFTDDLKEIPEKVLKKMDLFISELVEDNFKCACWASQTGFTANAFVIITKDKIIVKKPDNRISQNLFKDLTGVERSIKKDITLLSPGNKSDLFHALNMPAYELLDKLFDIINKEWNSTVKKTIQPQTVQPQEDNISKLKQLKELLDAGIINEDEFNNKKTELLNKI